MSGKLNSGRKVPPDEVLIELYVNQKLSSQDIAEKFNVKRTNVCRFLKRLGVIRPVSGKNSRYRKRHGEVVKMGYPVEHLPDHPRANHIGYVGKHVLEVEKAIGRTPMSSEPIHHIDLDRGNYHISNLYLCKSNSEHHRMHRQLERLASELLKQGIIKFTEGVYHL